MTVLMRLALAAGVFVSLISCSRPAESRATAMFGACEGRLPSGARCGTIAVPENRSLGSGRTIPIDVTVLPATGARIADEAIFPLNGGPGAPSSTLAGLYADSPARDRRDIVLVDQRGTGPSLRLDCLPYERTDPRRYLSDWFDPSNITACRDALAARADLAAFTTDNAARDLEDVRIALGYTRITLDGSSYGSRLAQAYARRFPASVRAVVLQGSVPDDYHVPLPYARWSQVALDKIFTACEADPECREIAPDVRQRFASLMALLETSPARATVPGFESFGPVTVSRGEFAERLRLLMYAPQQAALVPALVRAAGEGRWADVLAVLIQRTRGTVDGTRLGLHLSVTCQEDLPLVTDELIRRETAGTFLGDYRVARHRRACGIWPHTDDRAAATPAPLAAPALVISGDLDPITPPPFGEQVARAFSRARHVVAPNTGHQFAHPCLRGLVEAFIESPDPDRVDSGCTASIAFPRFRTLDRPR